MFGQLLQCIRQFLLLRGGSLQQWLLVRAFRLCSGFG